MNKIVHVMFLVAFMGFLAIPPIFMDAKSEISPENRRLQKLPDWPNSHDPAQFKDFIKSVESWISDRIGFRTQFVSMYGKLHTRVLGVSSKHKLTIGRDGHWFLGSHSLRDIAAIRDDFTRWASSSLSFPPPNGMARNASTVAARAAGLINSAGDIDFLKIPLLCVAIPQKHTLDWDKLPFYIRMFGPLDGDDHPEAMLLRQLPKAFAEKHILYPYVRAREENRKDALYRQKSFHPLPGRLTRFTSYMIAEKFGLGGYKEPEEGEFVSKDNVPAEIAFNNIAGYNETCTEKYTEYRDGFFEERGIKKASFTNAFPELKDLTIHFYYINENNPNGPKLIMDGNSFAVFFMQDLCRFFGQVLSISQSPSFNINDPKTKGNYKRLWEAYQPDCMVHLTTSVASFSTKYYTTLKEALQEK